MTLIVANNLTKTYATDTIEVKALQEVSFEIEAGAFLAFIGPSGSGKTTLLNLIGCLDKLSRGSFQVSGVDVVNPELWQAEEFRGQNIGFHLPKSLLACRLDGAPSGYSATTIVSVLTVAYFIVRYMYASL